MMKNYSVYILSNKNNTTLYVGVTNYLERRLWEHPQKISSGFTAKYNLTKLVYFEEFENIAEAIVREKQLKNWHRNWKENLIRDVNPHWQDLSKSWNISVAGGAETSSA